MFRLNRNDLRVMALIAEHRALTLDQIALGHGGNPDALGKRLNQLEQRGWLTPIQRGFGRGRGRPRKLLSISPEGLQLLRDRDLLLSETGAQGIPAPLPGALDHLLLLNWVLMDLLALARVVSFLTVQYVSSASLDAAGGAGDQGPVLERVRLPRMDQPVGFRPDAVFNIHHEELNKSLLFFLEVDMNTQDLANPDRRPGDIRHKVLCYQRLFEQGGYKRYEDLWGRRFGGFRLLFLTNCHPRLTNLCRLVREMPPSDFVWIADEKQLRKGGLQGPIWCRGGQANGERQSILGSQSPRVTALRKVKSA